VLSVFGLVIRLCELCVCVSTRARADGTVGLLSICFGDISGQGVSLLLIFLRMCCFWAYDNMRVYVAVVCVEGYAIFVMCIRPQDYMTNNEP